MKVSYSVILIFLVAHICHARFVRHTRSLRHRFEHETSAERSAHINAEYFFEKWLGQPIDISEEELMKQLLFLMKQLKNRIDTSAESDDYWLLRQG